MGLSECYLPILVSAEDLEEGLKDAKLRSLRSQGYRAIGTLPVEEHGKPCLAIIMEPPVPDPHPALLPHPEPARVEIRAEKFPLGWLWVGLSVLSLILSAMVLILLLTRG